LNHLGFRAALDAEGTSQEELASSLQTEARETLALSLAIDPAQEPVHAALGWLWLGENPEHAERQFQAALALLPDRDTLHLGLALSLYVQHRPIESARELSLECLINPAFLGSNLWHQQPLASLRASVAEQLLLDYKTVLADGRTPAWRKPQLAYGEAFARWWFSGTLPNQRELSGANENQRRDFELISRADETLLTAPVRPLERLRAAFHHPQDAENILRARNAGLSAGAIDGALARLETQPSHFEDLLRCASPNGIGVHRSIVSRRHFSIMHRVLDGPGYADLAPRQYDAFTSEFLANLFPERVTLPGPLIKALESN